MRQLVAVEYESGDVGKPTEHVLEEVSMVLNEWQHMLEQIVENVEVAVLVRALKINEGLREREKQNP